MYVLSALHKILLYEMTLSSFSSGDLKCKFSKMSVFYPVMTPDYNRLFSQFLVMISLVWRIYFYFIQYNAYAADHSCWCKVLVQKLLHLVYLIIYFLKPASKVDQTDQQQILHLVTSHLSFIYRRRDITNWVSFVPVIWVSVFPVASSHCQ